MSAAAQLVACQQPDVLAEAGVEAADAGTRPPACVADSFCVLDDGGATEQVPFGAGDTCGTDGKIYVSKRAMKAGANPGTCRQPIECCDPCAPIAFPHWKPPCADGEPHPEAEPIIGELCGGDGQLYANLETFYETAPPGTCLAQHDACCCPPRGWCEEL